MNNAPRALFAAAFVTTTLQCGSLAFAGSFEVQGLSPEGVAELGARAAVAEDGTAAFYNPGGLAFGSRTTLTLAPMASFSALRAQGEVLPFLSPVSVGFTASTTLPLRGPLAGRIRLGMAGSFMPDGVLRLITRAADKPFFPYYDNRTQRFVFMPAIAVRLAKWIGIGLGANVLAGVDGPAKLENGATGAPEPRIDIVARTVASAIFGLRLDMAPHSRLALVVHQSFGVPLRIETTADIGGVPLATQIETREALFDPLMVVLASSFDIDRTTLEADVTYSRWSAWRGPYLSVKSTLPGVNLESRVPQALFRDVVSLRIGASRSFALSTHADLVLRLGAGIDPTMLRTTQQGQTNLVDGDKFSFGFGSTLVLPDFLTKQMRIGFGGNGQLLSAYSQEKVVCKVTPCPETTVTGSDPSDPDNIVKNPGYPRLSASGSFWTFSLGVGFDL